MKIDQQAFEVNIRFHGTFLDKFKAIKLKSR